MKLEKEKIKKNNDDNARSKWRYHLCVQVIRRKKSEKKRIEALLENKLATPTTYLTLINFKDKLANQFD